MFKVPAWSQVHTPYHFQDNSADTLLITAGDSWTWGDSLGDTKARLKKDDAQYRLTKVYGALMSQRLGSDWINLALPGISNYQIVLWVDQLLRTIDSNYKKINCVITLTESGRHEEIQLLQKSVNSLQDNLKLLVNDTYGRVIQLEQKFKQVRFLMAHNFTDPGSSYTGVEKNWLEVMLDQTISNQTHIVVSEHIQQLNWDYVYPDTGLVIDLALERIAKLDSCQYCGKEDTRHPNEQGHQIWANYLLRHL